MEYIQCPHCLHKYGVNERIRVLAGKQIQCKQCQQPFRIAILGTPESSPDSASAADKPVRNEPLDSKQNIQAEQPAPVRLKKQLNTQFIILLVLLFSLFIAFIGLFIYIKFPQWLESKTQPTDTVASHQFIKPIRIFPAKPPKPVNNVTRKAQKPVDTNSGRDKTMLEGPDQASQDCRDTAAAFWIRIHVMSTSRIDTKTYMQLLDQGLNQPAQIRDLCHDRFLVARLTEAATQSQIPQWISHEVESLTKSR